MSITSIKLHFKENRIPYIFGGSCLVIAGITFYIMRSRLDSSISRGLAVTAKRGLAVSGKASVNALEVNRDGIVLGNSYALNNVSFISSNRQGPPSWVVRCLETGDIFSSQNSCADSMEFPASELSKHLSGLRDDVHGYHFERICMAA